MNGGVTKERNQGRDGFYTLVALHFLGGVKLGKHRQESVFWHGGGMYSIFLGDAVAEAPSEVGASLGRPSSGLLVVERNSNPNWYFYALCHKIT